MRPSKIDRLIEGLSNGDPLTIAIVVFAVLGTIAIFAVTEMIQRRRRRDRNRNEEIQRHSN